MRRKRISERHSASAIYVATCTLIFSSSLAQAQKTGANVTARTGIAVADDKYQSNCDQVSLAYSLDVEGRGRVFPQFAVDHFSGSGGGDVLCGVLDPAVGTPGGGLRLDGATRVGLGVGARLGTGLLQLEGVVLSGIITGRQGFVARGQQDGRRVMPHVGGQVSLILFRFVVLSAATNWTRLSLDVIPPAGAPKITRATWSPMWTMQVGVRVPTKR